MFCFSHQCFLQSFVLFLGSLRGHQTKLLTFMHTVRQGPDSVYLCIELDYCLERVSCIPSCPQLWLCLRTALNPPRTCPVLGYWPAPHHLAWVLLCRCIPVVQHHLLKTVLSHPTVQMLSSLSWPYSLTAFDNELMTAGVAVHMDTEVRGQLWEVTLWDHGVKLRSRGLCSRYFPCWAILPARGLCVYTTALYVHPLPTPQLDYYSFAAMFSYSQRINWRSGRQRQRRWTQTGTASECSVQPAGHDGAHP